MTCLHGRRAVRYMELNSFKKLGRVDLAMMHTVQRREKEKHGIEVVESVRLLTTEETALSLIGQLSPKQRGQPTRQARFQILLPE
jgi:hypothetical protein